MQTFRGILAAAIVASTLGACAPAAEHARNTIPARSKTTLVVQNGNWLEVAVYLVRGNMRMRMGSVNSMSEATFRIPDAYVLGVSDVTVQADPIGSGRTWTSPPIQVFPGAQLALRLENSLSLSNFAVYARN